MKWSKNCLSIIKTASNTWSLLNLQRERLGHQNWNLKNQSSTNFSKMVTMEKIKLPCKILLIYFSVTLHFHRLINAPLWCTSSSLVWPYWWMNFEILKKSYQKRVSQKATLTFTAKCFSVAIMYRELVNNCQVNQVMGSSINTKKHRQVAVLVKRTKFYVSI